MNARLFLIPLVLSSAACTQADDYDDKVGVEETSGKDAQDPRNAASIADAEPGEVVLANERVEFKHSWPAAANAIPDLAERFEAEAQSALVEAQATAADDQAAARGTGWEFRPHASEKEWKTVADLPDWLSLSASLYAFTGGAHPNTGFDSLLWDKRAATARAPLDLFRSAPAFKTALWGQFCALLNAEREERRGQPVDRTSDDGFDTCPEPREVSVLLGSTNGQTFDRVGILVGPYVAGPFVEGSYEYTLPVTSATIDAVKPEYVAAFSRFAQQRTRNSAR